MHDSRASILALEDGTIFHGKSFGAPTQVSGEVVFNTSMIGYPELLTDPSYLEQIVVMTYPIIGSYGVPSFSQCDAHGIPLHFESESIKVKGYAVHSLSKPSHWSSSRTLEQWLSQEKVPGIQGLDTRSLTRKIRAKGTMLGLLKVSNDTLDHEEVANELKQLVDPNDDDLVKNVTPREPIHYVNNSDSTAVVIDCGVKYGIVRHLLACGVNVVRVPYDYSVDDILEFEPTSIVISNGPGDPKNCLRTIETARNLIESDIPTLGICLGAQILALAAGADTYKLKFGHRAVNHPCLDLKTGRCYITTQNHGYSVKAGSVGQTDFDVRFLNANDKTVEGIQHKKKNIIGVQWHPESSPGPYDTESLFDQLIKESPKN
ncbi:MAG TPA: glutamine-hydrolyzing carbamoyl-phosphate synthase small subunit [Candidatus Dormibacteraeota bacterium]|nr:glutamine-hydrolyzing carbamoyl-phosphate synthase small subunit [Candidatus Dormibacteraeota bacterium]